jgi:hypothetical protein
MRVDWDKLLANIVNYSITMLFSFFFILQIEEVSHFHLARAHIDLAFEGDYKTSFLFKRLILLNIKFGGPKVVAEVSIGSDSALPKITKHFHFLLSHVSMRHYVHIEWLSFNRRIFSLHFLFISDNFLYKSLTEESNPYSHGHFSWLVVSNLIVKSAAHCQGFEAREELPTSDRLYNT